MPTIIFLALPFVVLCLTYSCCTFAYLYFPTFECAFLFLCRCSCSHWNSDRPPQTSKEPFISIPFPIITVIFSPSPMATVISAATISVNASLDSTTVICYLTFTMTHVGIKNSDSTIYTASRYFCLSCVRRDLNR